MKTLQSNLWIGLTAVMLSGTTLVACAQTKPLVTTTGAARAAADPAKTALLQPLQQMVTKLQKLQPTGDPDFDYSMQAKIHAQGLQDMLSVAVQNGQNATLQAAEQTLMATAKADAAALDGMMRQIKPSRPNQAYTQQQNRNVEAMNLKLQQTGSSDKLTSDYDKNAITLLLDQRQDAIDMANTYLQHGRNAGLRTYAEQLVTKAKQDMEQIKAMQN